MGGMVDETAAATAAAADCRNFPIRYEAAAAAAATMAPLARKAPSTSTHSIAHNTATPLKRCAGSVNVAQR